MSAINRPGISISFNNNSFFPTVGPSSNGLTFNFINGNRTNSYALGLLGYTYTENERTIYPSGAVRTRGTSTYTMYTPIRLCLEGAGELMRRALELRNSRPINSPEDIDPITPFEQRCIERVRAFIEFVRGTLTIDNSNDQPAIHRIG